MMMEIEEKGLFRSYLRFSVYAKRCKGKTGGEK